MSISSAPPVCEACGDPCEQGAYCSTCAVILGVIDDPETKSAARPTADPAQCPRCGGKKQRTDWLFCFACIVTFDEQSIREFAEARDELAAWIVEAEQVLTGMATDDPRYAAGKAMWEKRLKTYQALCFLVPEFAA